MTTEELKQLAEAYTAQSDCYGDAEYSVEQAYQAGFNTCLKMVLQVMRRWPDMPAGDWDNNGELLKFMDNG